MFLPASSPNFCKFFHHAASLRLVRFLILISLAGALCDATATASDTAITPGALVRDQFPWSFARVTMAGTPRSIAIPLATNLHVAFDVKMLRVHTAWAGSKVALAGYQFGQGATSLASFNGTVLWTMPPVCPWQAGARHMVPAPEPPTGSDYRGISTKGGGVTLLYDVAESTGRVVRVHESYKAETFGGGSAIARRFEIAGSEQPLWLLAHEELGALLTLSTNSRGCSPSLIPRARI